MDESQAGGRMSERTTDVVPTMTTRQWCPIGSLNAHTYNAERNECIWCGPNRLASRPGRWVDQGDGFSAWSVADEDYPPASKATA